MGEVTKNKICTGDAEGSSKPTKSDLQLAISNSSSEKAADNNNNTIENPIVDQAKKNPVNGGAGDEDNIGKTDEGQAGQPDLALEMEMDPYKLKGLKKNGNVADMMKLYKSLKAKTTLVAGQLEAYKKQHRSLLIEQQKLILQIVALEKKRSFREVEVENIKAEVKWLSELQKKKQQIEEQEMMLNQQAAGFQPQPVNSDSNPSDVGQMGFKNSDQA